MNFLSTFTLLYLHTHGAFVHEYIGVVAGQKRDFLCSLKSIKIMETEYGGNRNVALILSLQRGEYSRFMPQ